MVEFRLGELLAKRPGMSQLALARAAGLTAQTVNAIANNRTRRVDLDTLDKLAKALGCEPGELIGRRRGARRG
jgi:putative transcriptional regulator